MKDYKNAHTSPVSKMPNPDGCEQTEAALNLYNVKPA